MNGRSETRFIIESRKYFFPNTPAYEALTSEITIPPTSSASLAPLRAAIPKLFTQTLKKFPTEVGDL